jgi:hypothetical protein
MNLPVRTKNAMLLGNGLIAHIRTVQEYRKKNGKVPQRPYLTYTQLVEQTGAKAGHGRHRQPTGRSDDRYSCA